LAGFIGSLLNKRGQSGLDMRDVAVFVSLSSPDNNMCQVSLARLLGSSIGEAGFPVCRTIERHDKVETALRF
jgi:hypothetical protein